MSILRKAFLAFLPLTAILGLINLDARAQYLLAKPITLKVQQQRLGEVLSNMEQQGNFRFSYNSTILPLDSLVDLNVANLSVEETLNHLLKQRYEYKQAYNFIILRYAPLQMTLMIQESVGNQELYTITGKVLDEQTRHPVANASVYEKNLLASTITNADGLFTLRLKKINKAITITISKVNYKDITSFFLPEIAVYKNNGKAHEGHYMVDTLSNLEKHFLGRLLITSKQKIQTANIGSFIAKAPAQISLGPGLSSHGSLSGQVVNKFSFNITGDYNAGTDGLEIGLLYNMDKKDARYFQVGGAFNLVGGKFTGIQVAGLYNRVFDRADGLQVSLVLNHVYGFKGLQIGGFFNQVDQAFSGVQFAVAHNAVQKTVHGLQVGGLYNKVSAGFKGLQISTGYNHVKGDFKGLQVGGLLNHAQTDLNGLQFAPGLNLTQHQIDGWQIGALNLAKQVKGIQIGVLGNIARQNLKGIQLGTFNYAKKVKGLQLGLINWADTSAGYSLGLINIIKKGYHKISIGTNESIDFNVALKTGNEKLYTQLLFGQNFGNQHKLSALGLGLGKAFKLGKSLYFNPELGSRYIYQGSWVYRNFLHRLDLHVGYQLNRWMAIQVGPSLNAYYSNQNGRIAGYGLINEHRQTFKIANHTQGWSGWNVGIVLF